MYGGGDRGDVWVSVTSSGTMWPNWEANATSLRETFFVGSASTERVLPSKITSLSSQWSSSAPSLQICARSFSAHFSTALPVT